MQGYKVTVSLVTHDFGESAESGTPKSFTTKTSTDSQKSEIETLRQTVDKKITIFDGKFLDIENNQIPGLNTKIDDAVQRIGGIDTEVLRIDGDIVSIFDLQYFWTNFINN